jgi:hypothetical protein
MKELALNADNELMRRESLAVDVDCDIGELSLLEHTVD